VREGYAECYNTRDRGKDVFQNQMRGLFVSLTPYLVPKHPGTSVLYMRTLSSPTYSHGSPMDSDGIFLGRGLSIVCLSYWTFSHGFCPNTSDSIGIMHRTLLESDVCNKIIESGI
jgi:hypothetical protein